MDCLPSCSNPKCFATWFAMKDRWEPVSRTARTIYSLWPLYNLTRNVWRNILGFKDKFAKLCSSVFLSVLSVFFTVSLETLRHIKITCFPPHRAHLSLYLQYLQLWPIFRQWKHAFLLFTTSVLSSMDIFLALSHSELSWLSAEDTFCDTCFSGIEKACSCRCFTCFRFQTLSSPLFAVLCCVHSETTDCHGYPLFHFYFCKKFINFVKRSLATFSPTVAEDGCLCHTLSNSSGRDDSTRGYSIAAYISVVTLRDSRALSCVSSLS